ncbi:glycosyltransferase [Orbus wheelerorum]|uniref:glycosyltransferase n=1 Tax=Orbus wheelerorum TaxID=3074111 RepID=UPI00370DC687
MAILSVIVPVYNTEKFLERCLDSIVNQSLADIEIICVNDGSTDNSLVILEEYSKNHPQIKIINQTNAGMSSARNTGLENATSEYITFVDSDDYLDLNTYKECYDILMNYSIDLLCFGAEVISESAPIRDSDIEYYRLKYDGLIELNNSIRMNIDVCAWDKIYKKSIIDKYSINFPEGLWVEDIVFFWKYIAVSKSAYFLNKLFYKYIRRENSIMDNLFKGSDKSIDHLLCFNYVYDFLIKNNLFDQFKDIYLNIFKSCFYCAWNFSSKKIKPKILTMATNIVINQSLLEIYSGDSLISQLYNKQYRLIDGVNYCSFKDKIFSLTKSNNRKIIYFLGLKIKL